MSLNIIKDSTELRQLIADNPELPIVVMVGEDAALSDCYWTYCTDVRCKVGEILDCELPWEAFDTTKVYNDRIEFEEDLTQYLADHEDIGRMSDKEFDKLVDVWKNTYSQHWKKAIIVLADN